MSVFFLGGGGNGNQCESRDPVYVATKPGSMYQKGCLRCSWWRGPTSGRLCKPNVTHGLKLETKKNTIFVLMGGLNPMFVCKMWIWNFGALNSTLTLDFSQQPKVDCKLEIYKYDNYISRCPCKHLFMWQKTSILGPKSSCHIPTTARQQPWQQRSDEKKKNTHSWRRQNFTDVWLTMGSKQNHG